MSLATKLLFRAIFKSDHVLVLKIVEERPQLVDGVDKSLNEASALHMACAEGQYKIAKILVLHNANCMIRDGSQSTPLHQLATNHVVDEELLDMMLEKMNHVIDVLDVNKNTPLFEACQTPCVAMVGRLLELGANPLHRNEFGETALHVASMFPNHFVRQLLEQAGVDPSSKDNDGVEAIAAWNKAIKTLPDDSLLHENPDMSQAFMLSGQVCVGALVTLRVEVDVDDTDAENSHNDSNDDDSNDDDDDDSGSSGQKQRQQQQQQNVKPRVLAIQVHVLGDAKSINLEQPCKAHQPSTSSAAAQAMSTNVAHTNKRTANTGNSENNNSGSDSESQNDDVDDEEFDFYGFIVEGGVSYYHSQNNNNVTHQSNHTAITHTTTTTTTTTEPQRIVSTATHAPKCNHDFIPGLTMCFSKAHLFAVRST